MKKAIVLCSGGLDSVVVAHYVKKKEKYKEITILFFDYGQKTVRPERECALKCARSTGASFYEVKIPTIAVRGKKKHGKSLKDTRKESEQWYVPNRNLIFLSYALGVAEKIGEADIFVGFENEGREHYPDTTPEFVKEVNVLARVCCKKEVKILAPFIKKDKEELILLGQKLGVDFSRTFSCYVSSRAKHCGVCLACRLRKAGFKWSGTEDPTKYQTR